MTDDLVKAAREALVGVTEGPWWTEQSQYPPHDYVDEVWCNCGEHQRQLAGCDTNYFDGIANARFIASARSLVPAMADRIEALEAQLQTVCQREAETTARYDARIEALEAQVARLQAELSSGSFYQEKDIDALMDRAKRAEAALQDRDKLYES